jgi:hypothetical protein
MDVERLKKVEQLLRAEPGVELAPGFKQRVMHRIERLPAPEILAPRRSWRDIWLVLRGLDTGEKVGLGLALAGLLIMLLPGVDDVVAAINWQLADITISLSVGETIISASLISVISVAAGGLFMAGVGAYTARNHLVGT